MSDKIKAQWGRSEYMHGASVWILWTTRLHNPHVLDVYDLWKGLAQLNLWRIHLHVRYIAKGCFVFRNLAPFFRCNSERMPHSSGMVQVIPILPVSSYF